MPKWVAKLAKQSKNQLLLGAMYLSKTVVKGENSHMQSGQWHWKHSNPDAGEA